MNLDRHISMAQTAKILRMAELPADQTPALDLTFQDANGHEHTEDLRRYDGASYRVMSIRGAGITQRALIRFADGRLAEMSAYAL